MRPQFRETAAGPDVWPAGYIATPKTDCYTSAKAFTSHAEKANDISFYENEERGVLLIAET